jgi:glycosyltransferase involved in cell wall biosynthesis
MTNNSYKKLSIIIPCYNEKNSISEIINQVKNVDISLEKEIIVVDDFSTDGTREILKKLQESEQGIRILFNEKNMGKGYSIRDGFKHATGDIIIIQDADLEYEPNEYVVLLKPILNNEADVVYGSRFKDGYDKKFSFLSHYVGNKLLTMISNQFTGLKLTDMETCYKMFTKEILDKIHLTENKFGFEPEFTAQIAKINCRISEVGIKYKNRSYEEGKKITWKDGIHALKVIIKNGSK